MPPRSLKRKTSKNDVQNQSSILKFCKSTSEVLLRRNEVILIDSDDDGKKMELGHPSLDEKSGSGNAIKEEVEQESVNLKPDILSSKEQITGKVHTIKKEELEEIKSEFSVNIHEDIFCPICQLSIDRLSLEARSSHVNDCLISPNSRPTIYVSQKFTASRRSSETPKPKTGQPKEKKEPKQRRPKPPIPEHKILNFGNISIAVDAFCYAPHDQISIYLLTHFHSDHYGGLSRGWCNGSLIIVTKVTYNLMILKFNFSPEMMIVMDYDQKIDIPGTGLKITCLDANHCPGSGIFVIESQNGLRYLHCGDFRVNKKMISRLMEYKKFDKIYLDTTYLDPLYNFPKQEVVIDQLCKFIKEKSDNYRTKQSRVIDFFNKSRSEIKANEFLICIGTYVIGKEKLAVKLAQKLGSKIYCNDTKLEVVEQLEWPEFHDLCDKNAPAFCQVHIVPLRMMNKEYLIDYLKMYSRNFKAVIGISPTGWSDKFGKPVEDLKDIVTGQDENDIYERINKQFDRFGSQDFLYKILKLPYSEHSSFRELFYFVNLLNYDEIVPTVNMHRNEENFRLLEWFRKFEGLSLATF